MGVMISSYDVAVYARRPGARILTKVDPRDVFRSARTVRQFGRLSNAARAARIGRQLARANLGPWILSEIAWEIAEPFIAQLEGEAGGEPDPAALPLGETGYDMNLPGWVHEQSNVAQYGDGKSYLRGRVATLYASGDMPFANTIVNMDDDFGVAYQQPPELVDGFFSIERLS